MRGEFYQSSADPPIRKVAMSHLSIEVGHLYLEDLKAGPNRLKQLFTEAAPWVRTAEQSTTAKRPRVSTCFLIDDYFSDLVGPDEVMPDLFEAAESAGLRIDYVARESVCAHAYGPAGSVSPAEVLISQLVDEPPVGTTGSRPPVVESGWLSNGERSPGEGESIAMGIDPWRPPLQTAARKHSIFVDVELWANAGSQRVWSCALLAAAWQLLRLGLFRKLGEPLVEAEDRPPEWPSSWPDMPGLIKLNPDAKAFAAYRTMSVLSSRFLPVEQAVRTILSQVYPDPDLAGLLAALAAKEDVELPGDPLDRIGYIFSGNGRVDPR